MANVDHVTVQLFGRTLPLHLAGYTEATLLFPHGITGTLGVDGGGRSLRIDLDFSGEGTVLRGHLNVELVCEPDGDSLRIIGISTPQWNAGDLCILSPLGDELWRLTGGSLVVIPDSPEALAIVLPSNVGAAARKWFNTIPLSFPGEPLAWAAAPLSGSLAVTACFADGVDGFSPGTFPARGHPVLYHRPVDGHVATKTLLCDALLTDRSQPDHVGRRLKDQALAFDRLRGNGKGFAVLRFRSHTPVLYVQPEKLFKEALSYGDEAKQRIEYQLGLTHGLLDVTKNQEMPLEIAWRSTEGNAAILAYRYCDENGCPIALCTPSVPLGFRNRSVTAEALVPILANALDVDIAQIDVSRLPRKRDGFVLDGELTFHGAPREIHGLADATYLASTAPAKASVGRWEVKAIGGAPHAPDLTLSELILPEAGDWQLVSQTEDREVHPENTLAVGARTAAGVKGKSIRLPLTDYRLAVVNLVGNLSSATAMEEVHSWAAGLNDALCETTFERPQLAPQRHIDGYRLVPGEPPPRVYAQILAPPTQVVTELAALAHTGPILTSVQTDYELGTPSVPGAHVTARVQLGLDTSLAKLVELWATPSFDRLRKVYGPALDADAYHRLRESVEDAKFALDALNAALGSAIDDLAKVRTDGREYVLYTRSSADGPTPADESALWGPFALANNLAPITFSLPADGPSGAVIVKMSGKRTLEAILTEVEHLHGASIGLDTASIIRELHPDLADPSWRGLFFINASASLARLSDAVSMLIPKEPVPLIYAAVSGHHSESMPLDVTARIRYIAKSEAALGEGDVGVGIERLEATIVHSQLTELAEDVVVRFRDVLGGLVEDERKLLLSHTWRPGDQNSALVAKLSEPLVIPINVGFLDSLTIEGARVSIQSGKKAVDLDGELRFKDTAHFFAKTPVSLSGLRIVVPDLRLELGKLIPLELDLPSVTFHLDVPPLSLGAAMSILPLSVGYRRRKQSAPDTPAPPPDSQLWILKQDSARVEIALPFFTFQVQLGKLPILDGGGALDLTLFVGFPIFDGGDIGGARVGLCGLHTTDLRISLFRFLELSIEHLSLESYQSLDDGGHFEVATTVLKADNIRLRICGWDPFRGAQLRFLAAHTDRNTAFLASSSWTTPIEIGPIAFDWLYLAHNLELPDAANKSLLETDAGLFASLLKPPEKPEKLDAKISDTSHWAFGIGFKILGFIDTCRIVLDDQRFYGIRLSSTSALFRMVFGGPVTLAYIAGAVPELDRFRTAFRLPALDLLGSLRSGEIALEWGANADFLVDFGFPWRGAGGYDWFRSFALIGGIYEVKLGFYFSKSHAPAHDLTLAAGVGFYAGLTLGFNTPIVWARVGIGAFGILEGSVTLKPGAGLDLASAIEVIDVNGVMGIFAYGEAGIDLWILSARFRIQVQTSVAGALHYVPGGTSLLSFNADLSVHYEASVRVGCGFFHFTFSVSGNLRLPVHGQLLLH